MAGAACCLSLASRRLPGSGPTAAERSPRCSGAGGPRLVALHPFSSQSSPQPFCAPCSSTDSRGVKSGVSVLEACWCCTLHRNMSSESQSDMFVNLQLAHSAGDQDCLPCEGTFLDDELGGDLSCFAIFCLCTLPRTAAFVELFCPWRPPSAQFQIGEQVPHTTFRALLRKDRRW